MNCYKLLVESIKKSVVDLKFSKAFCPSTLVADAAESISNGFIEVLAFKRTGLCVSYRKKVRRETFETIIVFIYVKYIMLCPLFAVFFF